MSRSVLVDTSALYAALDVDDRAHHEAATRWTRLLDEVDGGEARAVTHGGIVVESSALVQRRLGIDALRVLHNDLLGTMEVYWIDAELHQRALGALLASGRRDVSLVDWTSFELMRMLGIDEALAFDEDFAAQGYASYR